MSADNINRITGLTVRVVCTKGVQGLQNRFSGPLLVVGGSPTVSSIIDKVNQFPSKKLLCTARDPGVIKPDFLFFSDTYTCRTLFDITKDTYLITRGIITDLHGQFSVNKDRWYHWSTEFKWGAFTGPCALRCAMYMGFNPVYLTGFDGVCRIKNYYAESVSQVKDLLSKHQILIPFERTFDNGQN